MRTWDDYKKTMPTELSLWDAAKANDIRRLTVLIYNGANIDARDHRGYSPLMLAVYAGAQDAAELLLEVGADPNSADFGGNSILMGAAFKGHLELVETLLKRGADPSARNATGLSAHDFAVTFGRTAVANRLAGEAARPSASRVVLFFKIMMSRFSSRPKRERASHSQVRI